MLSGSMHVEVASGQRRGLGRGSGVAVARTQAVAGLGFVKSIRQMRPDFRVEDFGRHRRVPSAGSWPADGLEEQGGLRLSPTIMSHLFHREADAFGHNMRTTCGFGPTIVSFNVRFPCLRL